MDTLPTTAVAVRTRLHERRVFGIVALGLVIGGALFVRLLWLNADPARNLTWSGAPFTDEGLYSHAARNRVLFGVWRTDEWDDRLVSPLWSALTYAVFRLLGVGYVQLRSINVLLATIALPCFWALLRADWGARRALLGTALWAFDYFWFQYSRLGLLEPGMVFWLIAAAWCWRNAVGRDIAVRPKQRAATWAALCGFCAGIAVVWKSLALVFVPVPLLALLLIGASARKPIVFGYLVALAVTLLGYGLLWYWPNYADMARYNRFYAGDRVPNSLADAGRVLFNNARSREVWAQTPIIAAAALLGAGGAFRAAWRRSITPTTALCLSWMICGAALLLMPYSPSRYYTLLLPPFIGLSISLLASTDNHYLKRYGATGLFALGLAWSGWWYGQWIMDRRTTLIDVSRAIPDFVQPGRLVLGVHACGLSLENSLPCAPLMAGLANDARPVERLGATLALVEVGNQDDFMRRFYGPLLRSSRRLREFDVGPRKVALYRLQSPAD